MNTPNPFKPPGTPVADVDPSPMPSRRPVATLLIFGVLSIAWFATWLPGLFRLVDSGSMKPILGLAFLLGELCLAVGLWRAFPLGLRGRRSFVLAIALLALTLVGLGFPFGFGLLFGPIFWSMGTAIAGFVLVRTRLRARGVQP
jgi:hypothetical protein